MSQISIRVQTYLVLGVMIACFSILYPKIFHPMLMHILGLTKSNDKEGHGNFEHFGPNIHHPPRPIRATEGVVQQDQGKRGGIMSIVLPVYAIGIILYLLYTLSKIFSSKRRKNSDKKEEFLRQYYRDFHYDVDRGKFRMGRDSSDDDDDDNNMEEGNALTDSRNLDFISSRRSNQDSKRKPFEWGSVFKDTSYPDVYRSARSLPKDLGKLLMRMERQDLDTEELSRLRVRLEQTEREMTRLLKAMQSAEDVLRDPIEESEINEDNYTSVPLDETIQHRKQSSESQDEEEEMGSAEEVDQECVEENEFEYSSGNLQILEEQTTNISDEEIDNISESCIRHRRLITST
ncbi:unnamed protein product [Heterobilharzia americana]|nr:unnamed protein product [Heterobilharzia americana]